MTTKTCSACKETKPVSEFHKYKQSKDGLRSYCKTCNCEKARRYREANKERVAEKDRKYREANRERRAEWNRKYKKSNREQEKRRSSKHNRETNDRSLELAHRHGLPWEDWEDEFVASDNGLTSYQKAIKLGRSLYSTRQRRRFLRKSARAELTNDQ